MLRAIVNAAVLYDYSVERRIVERAFTADPEDQQLLGRFVAQAAQLGDPRLARVLANEWIADPEARRKTLEEIESLTDTYSMTQP